MNDGSTKESVDGRKERKDGWIVIVSDSVCIRERERERVVYRPGANVKQTALYHTALSLSSSSSLSCQVV